MLESEFTIGDAAATFDLTVEQETVTDRLVRSAALTVTERDVTTLMLTGNGQFAEDLSGEIAPERQRRRLAGTGTAATSGGSVLEPVIFERSFDTTVAPAKGSITLSIADGWFEWGQSTILDGVVEHRVGLIGGRKSSYLPLMPNTITGCS